MKVKDLIMKLIYCNPDADIKCVTYEDNSANANEFALNIRTIEDYEEGIDIVLDNLDVCRFNEDYVFEILRNKVLAWAKDKDLLHEENADKQFMKFVEEVFEFKTEMDNVLSYTDPYVDEAVKRMELEMGDIFVTLIILCEQLNLDPVDCLGRAYEKIKDRQGRTIKGTFVKSEDL